jgi:hypothetical protein
LGISPSDVGGVRRGEKTFTTLYTIVVLHPISVLSGSIKIQGRMPRDSLL